MLRLFRHYILFGYVFREFLRNFVMALTVTGLVFLLGKLVVSKDELEEFGVSIGQLALLTPYLLPFALSHALPLATMIAAILAFGRLAAENELQAAQSAGASLLRLAMPILASGFIVSMLSMWCLEQGVDWGFSTLRREILTLRNPRLFKQLEEPGQTLSMELDEGAAVYINMLDHESDPASGRALKPIHVAIFSRGRLVQSFYAKDYEASTNLGESEASVSLNLTLRQMQSLGEHPKFFDEIKVAFPLPAFSEDKFKLGESRGTVSFMRNLSEARRLESTIAQRRDDLLERAGDLMARIQAGSPGDPPQLVLSGYDWSETRAAGTWIVNTRDRIIREMVEFNRKLALALMPLSLVFLGVGLGLLVRKSQRLVGFILGIVAYVLIYYPLMVISKELAVIRLVPPAALWTPNLVMIVLGLALWYAHEHGRFGAGIPGWLSPRWLKPFFDTFRLSGANKWRFLGGEALQRVLPFRRKSDRHVAGAFLAPLLTVALAVGGLYVAMDLVDHGTEVVGGIFRSDQALPGLPARGHLLAFFQACAYYGIRALGMIFDVLPILLLLAGVLAVTIMVRNNEHVIFKSCGTRLQKAFQPIMLSAVAISLVVGLIRELVWPALVMEVDRLKPLVYHRTPKGKAQAGQTRDAEGRLVLYEIEVYMRNLHTAEGVRLFMPTESVNGRIPGILADRATWNKDEDRWDLFTEDPSGPVEAENLAARPTRYAPHGYLLMPTPLPDLVPGDSYFSVDCQKQPEFGGTLTPAFLDSEKYGPSVMNVKELWTLRYKDQFRSEIWRRLFDSLTGFVLLMLAIPVLVKHEVTSSLVGIGKCILFGVAYVGANMGVAEVARQGLLFAAAPILPHLLFLIMGTWRYWLRMET
ncbi:MAG: LptF/LptG family permease [Planctomycetota bacterium]|nr:LptF/LptG family permease [Planctomycetota bacterium]